MKTKGRKSAAKGAGAKAAVANGVSAEGEMWDLRLYVAGQSPKSMRAFTNLKAFCEKHLAGRFRIEVVDLLKNPQLAAGDQILAIPTLVRKVPSPMRKIIGDMSSEDRTLVGFDLRPRS
jgi:circadian clock protein KaiB